MLKLENVQAGYGAGRVLFGVDLEITPGSCVSLLGRNGMGKTTTIRTIMGQLALQAGRISRFENSNVPRHVHEIARAGIGLFQKDGDFPILAWRKTSAPSIARR